MERSLYSQKYNKLRVWLREKRAEEEISIRELADKLDVHYSIIGKIESSGKKLDVVEFMDYCKALNAAPSEATLLLK